MMLIEAEWRPKQFGLGPVKTAKVRDKQRRVYEVVDYRPRGDSSFSVFDSRNGMVIEEANALELACWLVDKEPA